MKPEPYVCSLFGPLDQLWCSVFTKSVLLPVFFCFLGGASQEDGASSKSILRSLWILSILVIMNFIHSVQMLFGMFGPKYNTDLHHRTVNPAPLFIIMTSLTRPDQSQTFFFSWNEAFSCFIVVSAEMRTVVFLWCLDNSGEPSSLEYSDCLFALCQLFCCLCLTFTF